MKLKYQLSGVDPSTAVKLTSVVEAWGETWGLDTKQVLVRGGSNTHNGMKQTQNDLVTQDTIQAIIPPQLLQERELGRESHWFTV